MDERVTRPTGFEPIPFESGVTSVWREDGSFEVGFRCFPERPAVLPSMVLLVVVAVAFAALFVGTGSGFAFLVCGAAWIWAEALGMRREPDPARAVRNAAVDAVSMAWLLAAFGPEGLLLGSIALVVGFLSEVPLGWDAPLYRTVLSVEAARVRWAHLVPRVGEEAVAFNEGLPLEVLDPQFVEVPGGQLGLQLTAGVVLAVDPRQVRALTPVVDRLAVLARTRREEALEADPQALAELQQRLPARPVDRRNRWPRQALAWAMVLGWVLWRSGMDVLVLAPLALPAVVRLVFRSARNSRARSNGRTGLFDS